MRAIHDPQRAEEIYNTVMNEVKEYPRRGKKKWTNPSGDCPDLDVFEIENDGKKIWVSAERWRAANSNKVNRLGIITTIPTINENNLSQILEINLPLFFSRRFNTRLYQGDNKIEVRIYGKFTVGRTPLKKEYFFNYLMENGYENEILIDEDNEKYVSVFTIANDLIDHNYVGARLANLTHIIKGFKDQYRNKDIR